MRNSSEDFDRPENAVKEYVWVIEIIPPFFLDFYV